MRTNKLIYLIALILVLGLIVAGCRNPVVPPAEQITTLGEKGLTLVTVELKDSKGVGLEGGVVKYYSARAWQTFGTTDENGVTSKDIPDGNIRFKMTYDGASVEKAQNVASDPYVVFQTTLVTMKLLDSNNDELSGGAEYFTAMSYHTFGEGTTTTTMELLPINYQFKVSYGGAIETKAQNVASDPVVVFQATKVTLQFSGQIQVFANGWKTFTESSMNLLPREYLFQFGAYQTKITVSGTEMTKSIVIAKLLNSSDKGISGGAVEYYNSGWKVMGSTDSKGVLFYAIDGLKGTLSFKMSYAGAIEKKAQNVASDSYVVFQTTLVTMKLLDSNDNALAGGAKYYASGWKTFGTGTTETTMELLPVSYTFRVSYEGAIATKSQNVASDPDVVFNTTLVTMELFYQLGTTELVGGAEYYAGGYKTFGGGTTPASMELLPVSYTFRVSYAGAIKTKSQNVASDPIVIFQTGWVYSTNKICTQYYAGGWKTFTDGMDLLPGNYLFRFSDGFPQTSYPISAGLRNKIH